MKRRPALLALCAALAAGAWAQVAPIPARVAILGVEPADSPIARRLLAGIREGLAGEGLAEGRDFAIEYLAEARIDRVPAKVEALVRRRPALIVPITTPVAQAAASAARGIPIVFGTVSDPVGSGLVASLARPGGNVTGVSNMLPALSGKLLELAGELVPGVSRVAVLWNPANPAKAIELWELRAAAAARGIALEELPARTPQEIERALAPGARDGARLLVILAETLTHAHRGRIAELAQARRLVVVSSLSTHTEAGGVLSSQPGYAALNRRVGALAGKILKGMSPAELPVELPATFELLVNRKAAQALGLTLPQSLLIRADRVIE